MGFLKNSFNCMNMVYITKQLWNFACSFGYVLSIIVLSEFLLEIYIGLWASQLDDRFKYVLFCPFI